ncbi:MAG: cyclic nucleotide-binding domain-containing protein [Candidatus Zixiibacteriota bacterium]|jgi:CRP-like cAMP-binding protein
MKERIELLKRCELFKTLPPEGLEAVAERCVPEDVEAGGTILVETRPAESLYVVAAGTVDYIKRVDEKRGLVLFRWQVGDCFGLHSVMDGKEHCVSAVAKGPVKLLRLPVLDFRAVCEEDPLFEHRMLRQILGVQSHRLRQITNRLREFLAKIVK